MKRIFLIFNTLRYLKLQQIFFKLKRILIKPKVTQVFKGSNLNTPRKWEHIALYDDKISSKLEACFLNYTKKLSLPNDWNNESPNKLWVYNLHYFEDLLSVNAKDKGDFHIKLLNSWVDQNPVAFGNGWEPYPTSLRIVNILKAWLGGLELDEKLLSSVFAQASFLSNNLEKHLLGNHYFVNLKALLFAGVVFENKSWISIAEKGLVSEIPEQILEDGANFELSPMYHSLILVDMLDIFNLSRAYPAEVQQNLVSLLNDYIPKMLTFMEIMTHPDGGLSFFNDSVDGIAPTKPKIENYAKKMGFELMPLDCSKTQIIDNGSSGYICATADGNKLIFDAAALGPNYNPGHAHADTLSFELSIDSQRVFVNSGISEYGITTKRLDQRKTASHNTVEVNGYDSSQVWSSFRVAKRAEIISKSTELSCDHSIELTAAHNGYKSLFCGCIHTRKLTFSKNTLIVFDSLQKKFQHAKSRFYFHPNLILSIEEDILKVKGPRFILHSDLSGKVASLVNSLWHPEFGLEIPNKMLEVNFENNELDIEFKWSET